MAYLALALLAEYLFAFSLLQDRRTGGFWPPVRLPVPKKAVRQAFALLGFGFALYRFLAGSGAGFSKRRSLQRAVLGKGAKQMGCTGKKRWAAERGFFGKAAG